MVVFARQLLLTITPILASEYADMNVQLYSANKAIAAPVVITGACALLPDGSGCVASTGYPAFIEKTACQFQWPAQTVILDNSTVELHAWASMVIDRVRFSGATRSMNGVIPENTTIVVHNPSGPVEGQKGKWILCPGEAQVHPSRSNFNDDCPLGFGPISIQDDVHVVHVREILGRIPNVGFTSQVPYGHKSGDEFVDLGDPSREVTSILESLHAQPVGNWEAPVLEYAGYDSTFAKDDVDAIVCEAKCESNWQPGASGCVPCPEHYLSDAGDRACRPSFHRYLKEIREFHENDRGSAVHLTDATRDGVPVTVISPVMFELPGVVFHADDVFWRFDMKPQTNALTSAETACSRKFTLLEFPVFEYSLSGWTFGNDSVATTKAFDPVNFWETPEEYHGPYDDEVDYVQGNANLASSGRIPSGKKATVSVTLFFWGFRGDISVQTQNQQPLITRSGSECDEQADFCRLEANATDVEVPENGELYLRLEAIGVGEGQSWGFNGVGITVQAGQIRLSWPELKGDSNVVADCALRKSPDTVDENYLRWQGYVGAFLIDRYDERDHHEVHFPIRLLFHRFTEAGTVPISIWNATAEELQTKAITDAFPSTLTLYETEFFETGIRLANYEVDEDVYGKVTFNDDNLGLRLEVLKVMIINPDVVEAAVGRAFDVDFDFAGFPDVLGDVDQSQFKFRARQSHVCLDCMLWVESKVHSTTRRRLTDEEATTTQVAEVEGSVISQWRLSPCVVTKSFQMESTVDISDDAERTAFETGIRNLALAIGSPLQITAAQVNVGVTPANGRRLSDQASPSNDIETTITYSLPLGFGEASSTVRQAMDDGLTEDSVDDHVAKSFQEHSLPAPTTTSFSAEPADPPSSPGPPEGAVADSVDSAGNALSPVLMLAINVFATSLLM